MKIEFILFYYFSDGTFSSRYTRRLETKVNKKLDKNSVHKSTRPHENNAIVFHVQRCHQCIPQSSLSKHIKTIFNILAADWPLHYWKIRFGK